MLSHITIGTKDKARAEAFYTPLMAQLGLPRRDPAKTGPLVIFTPPHGGRPFFVIADPFDGGPQCAGNGNMVALLAPSRAVVDEIYTLACLNGARDEGAPGLRPQYHPNYYGAYFRDLDGNKVCIVCHDPVEESEA